MPRLSPEELATRGLGLGSTDVVEANGLAPWEGAGPMRLFCEKTGIKSADDEEEIDDGWMSWGHSMEPVIADWYAANRGVVLLPGGHVPSREHPWLWSTLDRVVVGQGRIVEIKNCGSPKLYSHWDVSSEDGVPMYVRAQVTVAMACHGARECDVVASIGGRPPHVWTVWWDEELARMLIDGAAKFWALVQAGTPPPLDATPASKEYLRAKYPRNIDPVMLEADFECDGLGEARIKAAALAKESEAEKDRLDAEILARVGDADGIKGEGWKLTWKCDKNGRRTQRFTASKYGRSE